MTCNDHDEWDVDDMFTLLDSVEIQLFYKVVHVIQEYVLLNYYRNHCTLVQCAA
jgi:hypothetical protein